MKIPPATMMAICGWFLFIDPVFAQTWSQTSAPSNHWAALAASADGSRLVAAVSPGPIYISTNSGTGWTLTGAPSNYWNSVTCSADGTKLVAVANGPIYFSTNSGSSWISADAPYEYWGSVASSADGNKLVAVAPVGLAGPGSSVIYTSTDSGATWLRQTNINIAFPGNAFWVSVTASADGDKLVAVGNQICFSTNSGTTWMPTGTPLDPRALTSPTQLIASSADGNKWVVGFGLLFVNNQSSLSPIYTSTNSGDSWTLTSAPSNSWYAVAMSADGNKIVAAARGSSGGPGPIYTSTDFGSTWTSNNIPEDFWYAVASSADGGRLVAASGFNSGNPSGAIYAAQFVPSPCLNIAQTSGNAKLSWIVPSTNFVLEQSSDLGSWADVTDPPVLNLTNLQNEVVLPLTNSSSFYRLKTP